MTHTPLRAGITAVVLGLVLLTLAQILDMRPSWPILLLAVCCGVALVPLSSLASESSLSVRWQPDESERARSRGDGRVVQLGHMVRSAATPLPDGRPRPSALALQRRIAVIARERAGDRPLPPTLAAYLSASPTVLDPSQLDRLLKELEDL